MARFKFRLATLLRLRESTRDECQSQLAQAYQAEELIRQEQLRLEGELAELRARARNAAAPGTINIDELMNAQRFELVLKSTQQHAAQQQEMVQKELERRRQTLVEANRDVRILETLREKQRDRHRDEENRRDIRQIDEVAQMRALREEQG